MFDPEIDSWLMAFTAPEVSRNQEKKDARVLVLNMW